MQIITHFLFATFVLYIPTYLTHASNSTVIYSSNTSIAEAPHIAKPGCPTKCGNLTVPYPFGIDFNSGCSINSDFDVYCNTSSEPPKAFLGINYHAEVLGISNTKIHIRNQVAKTCYNKNGNVSTEKIFMMEFSGTPFSFSNDNKLTTVGCDDVSLILSVPALPGPLVRTEELEYYTSSCVAVCSKTQDLDNGSCSGIGCCQSSIPKGLQFVLSDMTTLQGHSSIQHFNPCGYSFLAEQNSYSFNISDTWDPSFLDTVVETVPIALDWAIGNETVGLINWPLLIHCNTWTVIFSPLKDRTRKIEAFDGKIGGRF